MLSDLATAASNMARMEGLLQGRMYGADQRAETARNHDQTARDIANVRHQDYLQKLQTANGSPADKAAFEMARGYNADLRGMNTQYNQLQAQMQWAKPADLPKLQAQAAELQKLMAAKQQQRDMILQKSQAAYQAFMAKRQADQSTHAAATAEGATDADLGDAATPDVGFSQAPAVPAASGSSRVAQMRAAGARLGITPATPTQVLPATPVPVPPPPAPPTPQPAPLVAPNVQQPPEPLPNGNPI